MTGEAGQRQTADAGEIPTGLYPEEDLAIFEIISRRLQFAPGH